jgi:hypothetical protein
VDQQVYVIGLAVELPQFCPEVGAGVARDFFAAAQDLVGEDVASVLGDEGQMRVEGADDAASPVDIGAGFPSW